MLRDFQFGLRQIHRNPLFSTVVVVLLAIGIGSNTLVFSLVNELLLKPLPVRDPGNLYLVEENLQRQVRPQEFFEYLRYRDVIAKNSAIAAAVAEERFPSLVVALQTGGPVRLVMTQVVSPNYFTEFGVGAALGRVLTESDAAAAGAIPAVLSYQFWQSQFAGSRGILGQTIRLKDHPFVVVGVLPREFHSSDIDRAPDVRLPISAGPALFGLKIDAPPKPGAPGFRVLVRLAPGVTAAQAAAALQPAMRSFELTADPHADEARVALEPAGYGISRLREQFSTALRLLLGGVALLLVVVCANIAGLLLAKADERQREIGIRTAVGASRGQLIRQLLVENVLLAVPGAALGAALAYIVLPYVIRLLPNPRDITHILSPMILTVRLDLRVLAFTVAIAAACLFAFALAPALRATRTVTLRRARRGAWSLAPIALQVACSVLLLAAAALLLRTWRNLDRLDAGLDRHHVVEFTIDPFPVGYSPERAAIFYRDLKQRVGELPGVRSVAYAALGIMRSTGMKTTLAPRGVVLPPKTFLNTSSNAVSPGYFDTMGMRLLAGRDVQSTDVSMMPQPATVNEAFADFFFPHQNPIGQVLSQGTDGNSAPRYVVVGLTTNTKYRSMREPEPPVIYTARDDERKVNNSPVLHVRTRGSPSVMINAVRGVVASLDPTVPVVEAVTLEQEIQTTLWQERLVAVLAAFFGGIAVLLAGIGLYGALTYAVAHRTRELGIRVAIGARAVHIVRTICAPLACAVTVGIAAGLIASALLLRLAENLLFGIRALDPLTLAAVAALLVLFAGAAVAFPARRAIRISPANALREE